MAVAIQVENISKAYQLGEIGTGSLNRDLERWWAKVRGKEDPFLKIGEANDRTTKGDSDIVWSLKDISFQIEQGDAEFQKKCLGKMKDVSVKTAEPFCL